MAGKTQNLGSSVLPPRSSSSGGMCLTEGAEPGRLLPLVSGVEVASPWREVGYREPFGAWITARKLLLPQELKIPSSPLKRTHRSEKI